MKARKLIEGATYGPETLKVIGKAFDDAWSEIPATSTQRAAIPAGAIETRPSRAGCCAESRLSSRDTTGVNSIEAVLKTVDGTPHCLYLRRRRRHASAGEPLFQSLLRQRHEPARGR